MAGDPPPNPNPSPPPAPKRKRNLPGTPDPSAEVVALTPRTLLSATTFVCEVCGKDFRREQNLQIHRRGHNLPWKLKKTSQADAAAGAAGGETKKRVYVCPAEGCVYHDPSRALGDLTGIKKHYCRKHGEKRWECDRCAKKYAVKTDWKAHLRVCGSREFECPCGTLFSRKDSYLVHRGSCEATAAAVEEENDDREDPNSAAMTMVGFRANTVNTELLFPSLWGRVHTAREDEDEARQRAEGGSGCGGRDCGDL